MVNSIVNVSGCGKFWILCVNCLTALFDHSWIWRLILCDFCGSILKHWLPLRWLWYVVCLQWGILICQLHHCLSLDTPIPLIFVTEPVSSSPSQMQWDIPPICWLRHCFSPDACDAASGPWCWLSPGKTLTTTDCAMSGYQPSAMSCFLFELIHP